MKTKIEKTPSKKATASNGAKSETLTVWLPGDIRALNDEATQAGTTATNLARILIRDGLAKLKNDEFKITSPPLPGATSAQTEPMPQAEKLPIMFPAKSVQLLEELLQASGTLLSTADYAEEFLQQEIIDSLVPHSGGVPEHLDGAYELEPEDITAMETVVARWRAKK